MSENSIHFTENNIELLKYLNMDSDKFFPHKELTDKGFDLSEEGYALIRHLVRREGYNYHNYTYKIKSNGIGFLEEYYNKEKSKVAERDYQERTLELASDANEIAVKANELADTANKKSKHANIISWVAIGVSLLSILASFLIAKYLP